jgi:two-component system chemotaxis sensor kinase CheA
VLDPIKPRVLFVDDEPNVLHAISRRLRNDFEISTATSGQEALRTIADDPPFSVTVCDCKMPEMDGIELTRQLRMSEKFSALPIILVTSLESREDKEQGMHAGADAYIVKRGFSQTELLDTIEQLV